MSRKTLWRQRQSCQRQRQHLRDRGRQPSAFRRHVSLLLRCEGNRTAKFVDTDADGVLDSGDTDITEYTWDYRNRLTEAEHFSTYTNYSADTADQIVSYTYDASNRLIGRTLDADGSAGTGDIHQSVYVYDGDQVAVQFDKTYANGSASDLATADLSHRYLWNPQSVDQLFTDEQVHYDSGEAGVRYRPAAMGAYGPPKQCP